MSKNLFAVGVIVVAGGTALAQPPAVIAPRPALPIAPTVGCRAPAGTDGPGCGRRLIFVGSDGLPFGLAVNSHFDGHIRAGQAARMVFHDYDFQPDSGKLNVRGWDRAVEVTRLMSEHPDPVVVERVTRDPALAERRRVAVLAALGELAPTVEPARVVVGTPIARPLSGTDALIVYQTMLRLTASGGYLPSSGTGGSGSTGGGSPDAGGQPTGTPNNR